MRHDVVSGNVLWRKGGTWGGGCVHQKGANGMTVSGLDLAKPLIGTGRAVFSLPLTNGLRKQSSHLVGPPFLAVKFVPSLDRQ